MALPSLADGTSCHGLARTRTDNEHVHKATRFDGNTRTPRAAAPMKMPLRSMAVWWPTNSPSLTSMFSLVCYEDRVYGFVSGSTDSSDGQVSPWLEAIDFALGKLREGAPNHAWAALVGVRGKGARFRISNVSLGIGALQVECSQWIYRELRPSPTSLQSHAIEHWVPLIVRSDSPGYSWDGAQTEAHRQLHLLCALLSLETGSFWTLRGGPVSTERSDLLPPERTRYLEKLVESDLDKSQVITVDEVRLQKMWDRCNANDKLIRPVAAYYEALALSHEHPSFALVGFTSVIEEIGKLSLLLSNQKLLDV